MNKAMVLILCTGNSCRSQMAQGFLRKYHGDRYDVHSAGTNPAPQVHPLAVQVMSEVGVDISGERPRAIVEYLGRQSVKHLLIVCDNANKTCPRIWPGTFSRTYMPFDDPAHVEGSEAEKLVVFRRVRDEIDAAMKSFVPAANV